MVVLYIFILGCFVTGIVAVGLVFAFAAVGYASEDQWIGSQTEDRPLN